MSRQTSSALNRRQMLTAAARATGLGAAATLFSLPCNQAQSDGAEPMPEFKYAICNETFGDWPFEKTFEFVAGCGYRGIEIAPFTMAENAVDIRPKRRTEVRRLIEKNGLATVGLHWLLAKTHGLHLTSRDADVRRRTVEYLGELANLCADLGGRIMVFGSPKERNLAPGMTKDEGMRLATDVFQTAVPAFEKADVVLALEPLSTLETNFLTTTADGVELLRRIGSPRVALHLDCKAMASESTPIPDLIRKYRKEMVHFHANDPTRQGPGFGKLDFVPILQALRDVDYRGWVSVEALDYTAGPERIARESIAYMRRCADGLR